uniref:OTU domain-containing protein n=1 Tax=Panagrolaimus davidi TaxID=227884 RepID=A0A914Q2M9_9BILA
MLLNAVAEELMGNDNNSAENEDEELPVPGPSLRRNNGDEIGIQADPERESRRMRDRFEDLIRARFGHDGDVSERRQSFCALLVFVNIIFSLIQNARDKQKTSAVKNRTSSTTVKKDKHAKSALAYTDFVNGKPGDRVLTCGYGEQLGHPGFTTIEKPLAVETLPADTKILQVVAGGVHTTILTAKNEVYSCGINVFGTVPVKGKIVQLTSGARFTAALTHLGGVIAWGILEDEYGAFEVHYLFAEMNKGPTVIIHHNDVQIVKTAAGENHLVMLSSKGEIYTFGVGSLGQLGTSTRTMNIRSTLMADVTGKSLHRPVQEGSKSVKFSDIFAGGYWTMARATDGRIFACGLNNYGQLGFPLLDKENNFVIDRLTYSSAFPSKKKWTHIVGGKHIVARNDKGEVYGLGLNIHNELGIGTYKGNDDEEHWRYFELKKIEFPDDLTIAGITAGLGCSIAWTDDGDAYGFGCDSFGQLGNTNDNDIWVTTPRKITSAHLDDDKIISVIVAFQHSVFLATRIKNYKEDPFLAKSNPSLATDAINVLPNAQNNDNLNVADHQRGQPLRSPPFGNFITDFVRPYNPPSESWIKQTCERLNIPYVRFQFTKAKRVRDITDRVPSYFIPVKGDGHCGFRALAALITGSQRHHGIIRRLIMQELIANKNRDFETFTNFENAKSLAKKKLRVDTTKECREEFWMDEPDIAAASHILQCNIFVQGIATKGWQLYNSTVYENGHGHGTFITGQPVLLLTNVSRKHFGAVVSV